MFRSILSKSKKSKNDDDHSSQLDFSVIQQPEQSTEDVAAERSDLAKKFRSHPNSTTQKDFETQEDIYNIGTNATDDNDASVPEEVFEQEKHDKKLLDEQTKEAEAERDVAENLGNTDESDTSKEAPLPAVHVPKMSNTGAGMILEAAFVDPAYSWPPVEGQGKNAIELQASVQLLDMNGNGDGNDDDSLNTTASEAAKLKMPTKPTAQRVVTTTTKSRGIFGCCCRKTSTDEEIITDTEQLRLYYEKRAEAEEYRRLHAENKRSKLKKKERQYRMKHKYSRVPEGILIYRLDTSTGVLELMSKPHNNTNLSTLITSMRIVEASASNQKSRRGLNLVGDDGTTTTLIACEQRTATAWLEALSIMFAKTNASSTYSAMKLLSVSANVRCLTSIIFTSSTILVAHSIFSSLILVHPSDFYFLSSTLLLYVG
jgi:hypothetical protein